MISRARFLLLLLILILPSVKANAGLMFEGQCYTTEQEITSAIVSSYPRYDNGSMILYASSVVVDWTLQKYYIHYWTADYKTGASGNTNMALWIPLSICDDKSALLNIGNNIQTSNDYLQQISSSVTAASAASSIQRLKTQVRELTIQAVDAPDWYWKKAA